MRFGVARGYAPTASGQLHYYEAGTGGDTVVLLHKNPSAGSMYLRVVPHLAERYRVLALDTPGYGMSDPPPEVQGDMGYYAAAVRDLLDATGIGAAHVVGHHTGASIALEVAAAYPDRVRSAALVGLLALADDAEREEYWPFIKRFQIDTEGRFLETYPFPMFREHIAFVDGEHYQHDFVAALQTGEDYWWAYNAVFRYEALARLDDVRCPLLFLNARDDYLVFESTRRAASAVPGAAYLEVPGTSELTYEDPAGFAEVLDRFFTQASAAGSGTG